MWMASLLFFFIDSLYNWQSIPTTITHPVKYYLPSNFQFLLPFTLLHPEAIPI